MIKFLTAEIWRPVLVKILTIKFHQLQQILWTCCVFLLSLNNTFFSVLVIIFSNKCYFSFNYTNTFFIHPWIIFGPCIWSGLVRVFHFLRRPFWKLCKWRSAFKENAKAKHCQGKKRKRFSSFLQNLSGASSLCVRDEVFWTEDLIEETTKGLHDSYTILNLIEHDMSAQLNCSLPSLVPRVFVSNYTCWLSEQRHREWECPLPWSSGRISRF